ncbi:MAG: heme NO-binding domain-containing protein [Leeuwenhoekiella sp.]
MKGIIFTEFLELVEDKFGLETLDDIIELSDLPSGASYTSVGTYDFNEMVSLLGNLSEVTKIPAGDLLHAFGLYLFEGLNRSHPWVIENYTSPIPLIYAIEDHIHVHVKKLYPDAVLPTFKMLEKTDDSLRMIYKSDRGLYRLAQGLIEKTFIYFNETATVTYELLNEKGTEVKFHIAKNGDR